MAKTDKKGDTLADNAKTIVIAIVIALSFHTVFFKPFWIPSSSMKPTLLVGDYLAINKMAYGYSRHSCPWSACPFSGRIFHQDPERGDIVVFKHPTSGVDFIKRVVGLPGDTVQMRDGRLIVNGDEFVQTPDGLFVETYEPQGPFGNTPACSNGRVALGADCEKEAFIETMSPEKSYSVLNIGEGFGDNSAVFVVPPEHYFFIGDNRDNSGDSRFPANGGGVGYVHQDFVIGRADRIIFSSAGRRILFFWTWRKDRFFKGLN